MNDINQEAIQETIIRTSENQSEEKHTFDIDLSKEGENAIYYASKILELDSNLATEVIMNLGLDVIFNVIPNSQKKAGLIK